MTHTDDDQSGWKRSDSDPPGDVAAAARRAEHDAAARGYMPPTYARDPWQPAVDAGLLPELHPRWDSHTHRLAALGRIDPARWPAVEADLALVDAVEDRLTEMTFPPDPRGRQVTAADHLAQLLATARYTIVQWHVQDQHRAAHDAAVTSALEQAAAGWMGLVVPRSDTERDSENGGK